MEKVISFIKNNKFNISVLILYLLIASFALFHHELWRDEAQAWCLVRDMDFSGMFYITRTEGHPLMWYLILFPFAKMGASVISMQIISLVFVFLAVFFFLFKSPFNNWIKVLTIFSAGMLYYLPVVARNYCLIPIFLFLLAYTYKDRKEKPVLYTTLLILLSNTHSLMLGFCATLALFFCYEMIKSKINKTKLLSIVFLIINFVFLFLCFWGMNEVNHATMSYGVENKFFFIRAIHFLYTFFLYPFNKIFWLFPALFFLILIITCLISFFKQDKKIFTVFTASLIFQWYIYYNIWYMGVLYQKSFIFILIMIFCYWIYSLDNKSKILTSMISIFLLCSFISSGFVIKQEIQQQFSGSKQTAKYIRNNLNDEKIFFVYGEPYYYSVLSAYLPDKKFYMANNNFYVTYHTFDVSKINFANKKPEAKYHISIPNSSFSGENIIFISDTNPIFNNNEIFAIYKK